jgi:transcriptional regulator with XRE-family HTH domain
MKTLKEARESLGIKQIEVANRLNIAAPQLSLYESGHNPPTVEDCIILEREFSQPLRWPESGVSDESKQTLISCFNQLAERYPVQSVVNFMQRWLTRDAKVGVPERTIEFFTSRMIVNQTDELLLPPGVGKTNKS